MPEEKVVGEGGDEQPGTPTQPASTMPGQPRVVSTNVSGVIHTCPHGCPHVESQVEPE